ncbi:MAG: hypothetical protein HYZ32_04580, partial [Hydrocarboniphaga effusa]|nr:hypothetical protein [Hydrocarboniphaga effusa]
MFSALAELHAGRADNARLALERLVNRQPNFRLAQMFYGELLATRSGGAPGQAHAALAAQESKY